MLTPKDIKIISSLRTNARQSLTVMSKRTGIPTSTLYDKIRAQEHSVIKRYTSIIDFGELGFGIKAELIIKANRKRALQGFLSMHPNVNSLFKLGNDYDFLAEVVFSDTKALSGFITLLHERFNLKELRTFRINHELKREGFLDYPEAAQRHVYQKA